MAFFSKAILAGLLGLLAVLLAGCGNSGLTCSLEHCDAVVLPGGATDCSQASCQKCSNNFDLFSDEAGGYCGPVCQAANCAKVAPPSRKSDNCSSVPPTCLQCNSNFEVQLDAFWQPTGECTASCSSSQTNSGCESGSCDADGSSCTACLPGFELASVDSEEVWDGEVIMRRLRGRAEGGKQKCVKAKQNVAMNFFMYRAQSTTTYPPENVDLASAAGVMWYLHNEVVDRRMSCLCDPDGSNCVHRHYDITRVLRYKVTVYNTPQVHSARGGQLGPFVQFDMGMCTLGNCENVWAQYGYQVGCQNTARSPDYGDSSVWYSLPGPCPILKYNDPNKKICSDGDRTPGSKFQDARPGGAWCDNHTHAPDGSNACTWTAEYAGEIDLDELAGITDHLAFCKAEHYEYDDASDVGNGNSFWNNRSSKQHNLNRVLAMMQLFAKRWPEQDNKLPEPRCDF